MPNSSKNLSRTEPYPPLPPRSRISISCACSPNRRVGCRVARRERRRVTLCRDIGGAMRGVSKHRGVPAPRAAEDISAALRDDGHAMNSPDQNGSTRREQTSDSTPHLKSPQQQQRQDCSWRSGRWPPFLERRRTRNSGAVFLLLLAGAFSLRGWRAAMMIDMGPSGVQPWTASPETDDPQLDDEERNQCNWEPNGPLMFNLHHSKQHADGEGMGPLGVGIALGDQMSWTRILG